MDKINNELMLILNNWLLESNIISGEMHKFVVNSLNKGQNNELISSTNQDK